MMFDNYLPLFQDNVTRKPEKVRGTFASDATQAILGIEYQKLIAIEKCLQAGRNEIIYLECFGDVARNRQETVEVKHHAHKTFLRDTSVDLWKTLRNLVREKETVRGFSRAILHTTALIKKGSSLDGWNTFDGNRKLKTLRSVKPNKTVGKMFEEVCNHPDDVLLDILGKFLIEASQPNIMEKMEELKGLPAMRCVPGKYRERVLRELIGYVTHAAIDNRFKWQIESNAFEGDFQFIIKPYLREDIVFPVVRKEEVDADRRDFRFVEEIRRIGYGSMIPQAVMDYLRAGASRIELLYIAPVIREKLDLFDDDLTDILRTTKIAHCDKLTSNIVGTDDSCVESRRLYESCHNIPKQSIQGVQEIQRYYQNGRIHDIVELGNFSWCIEKGDFENV